jgi:transaldolase
VAVWLDDLSRELLASGELQLLITGRHVVGVTTNPTIFASALAKSDRYDGQLSHLAELGTSTETAIFTVTIDDVRAACDVLFPMYQQTAAKERAGLHRGRPRLARDGAATADMARALRSAVGRDNMFVKIPSTPEGLSATTQVTSEGISVNVTLIFALARYRAVMDAYLPAAPHDAVVRLNRRVVGAGQRHGPGLGRSDRDWCLGGRRHPAVRGRARRMRQVDPKPKLTSRRSRNCRTLKGAARS